MEDSGYEIVHTITDWYDGARTGIADFQGRPHYYQCKEDYGPNEKYFLTPLDDETFQYAMEDLAIFQRWQNAFDKGLAPIETHPALPEDRVRHLELSSILTKQLLKNQIFQLKVKATFLYGHNTMVKWQEIP